MNCLKCNKEMIWGGDHDYEDCGIDGSGIVMNFSCLDCESFSLFYYDLNKGEEYETSVRN